MTAAEPDWLDLRRAVDDGARQESLDLLDAAVAGLNSEAESNEAPLLAIDIGAGTGNSAFWFDTALRARLPETELDWVLLDSDQASLDLASTALPHAHTVCAPITALPDLTAELLATPGFNGARLLLTCSALLDVLTESDLTAIIHTLENHNGRGLFLLSIVGGWALDPPHPQDAAIDAAFTAHQHRDGRLGCHAAHRLIDLARDRGLTAVDGSSPWRLEAPADRAFLTRFLSERLDAALEAAPELTDSGRDWWRLRQEQLDSGLHVKVEHLDVLVDAAGRVRVQEDSASPTVGTTGTAST